MNTIPNKPGVYNVGGLKVVVTTEAIIIDNAYDVTRNEQVKRIEPPKRNDFWDNADKAITGINLVLTGKRG